MKERKVVLCALDTEQVQRTLKWVNDPQVTRFTGTMFPIGASENEAYWKEVRKDRSRVVFGVETHEGKHIGNVELRNIDWISRNAETTFYIGDSESRGKGYGNEMLAALCDFAFMRLGMHRLNCRVFAYNKIAAKMVEWVGFRQEGVMREQLFRDGGYHDIIFFGALRTDYENAPCNK
jgi:RimJ/RimL family protein N-acetyltransferase